MKKLVIPKEIYYLFDQESNPVSCSGGIPEGFTPMTEEQSAFYRTHPEASGDEVRALTLTPIPPTELRERRYEAEIPRRLLDAFVTYTAEGKHAEAAAIATEITAIKERIREAIPDE